MGEDHFLNLQPGTIVNGRYEVVKCLGTGSMGMVYACRHRELSGHLVAMKVLFSEVAKDEVAAARFRNEIVASYGVNHPHVVRAYEYFKDGDLIAFTMEYVGGGDLADRIADDVPIPIEEIVHMLIQMCSGVQSIHDAGIIHRDLKPENILLTGNMDVKITDFGIAKNGTGPKLTEYGGVVGTIDYVSPEYLEKGQVDTRSDIYSLGVLAYEMITGCSPFQGKSVIETMTMRLRTSPELPHEKRLDCPEALGRLVLKALDRDLNERYQTANQMIFDLIEINDTLENKKAFNPLLTPKPRAEDEVLKEENVVVSESELPMLTRAPSPLEASTARNPAVEPAMIPTVSLEAEESSRDESISEANYSGTVLLDAESVGRLKAEYTKQSHSVERPPFRPLDQELPKPQSLAQYGKDFSKRNGGISSSNSFSRSDSGRLQELSSQMYSPKRDGFFKYLIKIIVLVLLGFIGGVVALTFLQSILGFEDHAVLKKTNHYLSTRAER